MASGDMYGIKTSTSKTRNELIKTKVESANQDEILQYFGEAKSARDLGLLNKAEAIKNNK